MTRELTRVVSWAQGLLAEVLSPGDLAVDLTAGNGRDTLALTQMVMPGGRVVAFDIQTRALEITRQRLQDAGNPCRGPERGRPSETAGSGVDLLNGCHSRLQAVLPEPPRAVIANLGYLPGGDQGLVTRADTTLQALTQSCDCLLPGGRLAVVVYHEHDRGEVEAAAVSRFFAALDEKRFAVLELRVANRPRAPFLFVAEKTQS